MKKFSRYQKSLITRLQGEIDNLNGSNEELELQYQWTFRTFLQKILTFLQKVVVSYRTRKSWWFPTEYAYLQKIRSLAPIRSVTRIFRVVSHIVRDCNARNVYSEFTSGHARSLFIVF